MTPTRTTDSTGPLPAAGAVPHRPPYPAQLPPAAQLPYGARLNAAPGRCHTAPVADHPPTAAQHCDRSAQHGDRPRQLADTATAALLAEAELTPKPGLVDQRGGGAHQDMDVALMCRSAHTLHPWFAAMARAAEGHHTPHAALRGELAALGRAAEAEMLSATGGVNTHRGAVWALGLLTAAAVLESATPAGRVDGDGAHRVARTAGRIARFPDPNCPADTASSNGARVRTEYGVHGARGQAEAGFPHVTKVALATLRSARALDDTGVGHAPERARDTARLDALLGLMAELDDTCVLHRGGRNGLRTVQRGAAGVLRAGGCGTPQGRALLGALDVRLTDQGLSAGGCADLLAAALFLDALHPTPTAAATAPVAPSPRPQTRTPAVTRADSRPQPPGGRPSNSPVPPRSLPSP